MTLYSRYTYIISGCVFMCKISNRVLYKIAEEKEELLQA